MYVVYLILRPQFNDKMHRVADLAFVDFRFPSVIPGKGMYNRFLKL